jgi:PAS domain S-box-containing protein
VVSVGRDVTAELRAERDRAEAEARYRRLAEQLPIVTYIDDIDVVTPARYISAGIEELVGVTPDALMADVDLWYACVHPDDRDRHRRAIEAAYAALEPHLELEFRVLGPDGGVRWIRDEAVLVRDDAGSPLYYQGFLLDLTERRELEARYLQAQKLEAVGRLAGGIAHDFNNILTAIAGYASFLRDAVDGDQQLERDAGEIVDACARAGQLTRQLLAFSRRQVLQPRPVPLNTIVTGIERMLARVVGEDVRVTLALSDADPWIHADPGPVEQVVLNLVVNARDAMPHGGPLRLATSVVEIGRGDRALAPGSYALLEVADDGVGMDEATLARAFEPFFTTKAAHQGSGLGLATVFGIVTQSNGHVEIASAPHAGTTVRVYLPTCPAAGSSPGLCDEPAGTPADPGARNVLLVEDDPVVRSLTQRMLERSGHRAVAVGEGDAALAAVADEPAIDLVVADVVLPGLSGTRLAAELRAIRPEVPILFISGYAADRLGTENGLPDNARFLAKPFTQGELDVAIRELVAVAVSVRGRGR